MPRRADHAAKRAVGRRAFRKPGEKDIWFHHERRFYCIQFNQSVGASAGLTGHCRDMFAHYMAAKRPKVACDVSAELALPLRGRFRQGRLSKLSNISIPPILILVRCAGPNSIITRCVRLSFQVCATLRRWRLGWCCATGERVR